MRRLCMGPTDLDRGDTQPARLKQDAHATGCDAFAQPTDHSSCDQHILHDWGPPPRLPRRKPLPGNVFLPQLRQHFHLQLYTDI